MGVYGNVRCRDSGVPHVGAGPGYHVADRIVTPTAHSEVDDDRGGRGAELVLDARVAARGFGKHARVVKL